MRAFAWVCVTIGILTQLALGQEYRKWPEHVENISLRSYYSTVLVEKILEIHKIDRQNNNSVCIAICSLNKNNDILHLAADVIIGVKNKKNGELISLKCDFNNIDDFGNKISDAIEKTKSIEIPFREISTMLNRIEKITFQTPAGRPRDFAMSDGFPNCVVIMHSNSYVICQSFGADFWGPNLELYLSDKINKLRFRR